MDFDLQNASAEIALTTGTLLHDRYRILSPVSMDTQSITYEAADGADVSRVCVREYCPMDIVMRVGTELTVAEENEAEFVRGAKEFVKTGKLLQRGMPHIAPVTALFNANGTTYITSDMPEGLTLSELEIPITPTYLQSLGIALCDSLAALHAAGLYYGAIREEHICFTGSGSMLLSPEPIRSEGSAEEDVLALREFLAALMPTEETDDPADAVMRAALKVSYPSADLLRTAILAANGTGKASPSRKGILGLLVCLFFLAASLFSISRIPVPESQLAAKVETGKFKPQVISVWMPLPEGADEAEVCAMYERLTDGFEAHHPGCGIKLRIYADDSFSEALAAIGEADEQPAVLMDTQDPIAAAHAADITALTSALQDIYVADLTQFHTFVPLGCSMPVLLYNEHRTPDLAKKDRISFDKLPANTLFDVSAAEFIEQQGAKQKPAEQLEGFLNDGRNPILASSSCIVEAEHTGISAGAVHMLPVETGGSVPFQYEMYCSINKDADAGAQQVGMLWIQYLLTEEAQQILFVEHYSDLPLHRKALDSAANTHKELAAISKAAGGKEA